LNINQIRFVGGNDVLACCAAAVVLTNSSATLFANVFLIRSGILTNP
jgi:hypothetical protein